MSSDCVIIFKGDNTKGWPSHDHESDSASARTAEAMETDSIDTDSMVHEKSDFLVAYATVEGKWDRCSVPVIYQ